MNGDLRMAINVKGMLKRRKDKIPSNENKENFRIQNSYVILPKMKFFKKVS